jgi:Type I phosphodiesterase / nucleotide pyrophosphatase
MVPFRSRLYALMHWPTPDRTQAHRVDYTGVMAQAESLIEDTRIRFVFIHLPVPHPPGIYDRAHHAIRDHGTYLDNLVLADESLARLRSVIQSTPAAANTTLIVSSDHSWRTFLWKHSEDWSAEGAHASRGEFDPRPVLIVSLPEGDAHVVAEPAGALAVHSILDSLMRDQMRTTADIEELVGKLSPENAAPENAAQENAEETRDAQTHN